MKFNIRILLLLALLNFGKSTSAFSRNDTTILNAYSRALLELESVVNNNGSFKDAVFLVENVFFENKLDREKFYAPIENLVHLSFSWIQQNQLTEYKYSDSINFKKNAAIFSVLKDTIRLQASDSVQYIFPPFDYDFEDFSGSFNWSNMFVSKLLITRKGNCHSLPYLYKILADELGATCWLSIAPNHLYIRNRSRKMGWYNTELTSGNFPIDAWITASGYIPIKAIQNGIYMDTLSNQQSIALTVLDLAKGYEFKTRNYNDGFILKCCNLALQLHPVNVQALLLKAETLKRIYENIVKDGGGDALELFNEMESLYAKLLDLGYREMPATMYLDWIRSMNKEKNKFTNQQVNEAIKK